MPIYVYKCICCGQKEDIIKPISRMDSEEICGECNLVMKRQITTPAKTATLWGVDWRDGLSGNGYYSRALGRSVSSKRVEEKEMKAKGFIPESELGAHYIDDRLEKEKQEKDEQDAINKTYKENLTKFNGDKIKAVTETFPAHEMLKQE